ncbi:MAG: glycosyltransferase, partial [Lachnospiraceae bacterium]|nr:glycosyltransferase [Lachnospiraceae bacterium]
MEALVSIILPIYRVEKYLGRAIDSCLSQTYSHLEIILVDDGSDDSCGEICDTYAKKDARIRVIHKENGGLSDARNAGLDVATGDYIAFVDSDDYIAPDFIESLLCCIREEDADLALCSYVTTEDDGLKLSVFEPLKEAVGKEEHIADGEREVSDSRTLLNNLYDRNHRDATYFIVAWNKLYKAELWKEIRFPKGKIHEDEAIMHEVFDRANKGVYLRRKLYAYYQMPGSITRGSFQMKRLDWLDALDKRVAYFEEKGDEEQVRSAKEARANGAIHYYYRLKDAFPGEVEQLKRLKGYVKEGRKASDRKVGYTAFLLSPFFYRTATCVERDDKERLYQLLYSMILIFTALLCLYKLGVKYVDPWDEARHGVNAYEMLRSGNLIKSTYLYETDYYNLKPMLSMWLIMAFMKVLGPGVIALRLPSVCCYLLLCVLVGNFVRNRYGRVPALFSMMFLAANTTPFLAHMVRSGDADSLYVLLFSVAMMEMIRLKERPDKLWVCGLMFSLAFLTKSFHAGIIALIGIVFLIGSGVIRKIKVKHWVGFFVSTLAPVGIWAILRYRTDGTQFFRTMWETDVMGRTSAGFGSNEAGFGYYFSYYLGRMSGELQVYLVALVLLLLGMVLALRKNGGLKALKNSDVLGFA